MNKFAEWIEINDVKQKGVAKKIGVSTSTLHELLRLGKMPSLKVAYEIEKYTGGHVTVYDWIDQKMQEDITPKRKKSPATSKKKK